MGLRDPILAVKLCEQRLTAIAAHETGALLAVGNSAGNVYLVESTEALYSFDKNDRNDLTSVSERLYSTDDQFLPRNFREIYKLQRAPLLDVQ